MGFIPGCRPVSRCNDLGIQIIKEFEGCQFHAYQDQAGIWTIGYGSTTRVTPNMVIDQSSADKRLCDDLEYAENVVFHEITVPLSENQFSALVSFTFNEGPRHLENSTTKRLLNSNLDYIGAAQALLLWDKVRGTAIPGLLRRRQAECGLFLTA
jgi:lysozyme